MPRLAVLLLVLLAIPLAHAIVINEIMYNPVICSDADCEWVELYNDDTSEVDLTGWDIKSKTINGDNLSVLPYEYIVVARRSSKFREYFNTSAKVVNASWSSLSNTKDTILLKDSFGQIIDALTYNSSWGGSNSAGDGEYSLSRISPSEPTNSSANWHESFELHGTPGRENFHEHDLEITNVFVDYNCSRFIYIGISNRGLNNESATIDCRIDGIFLGSETADISVSGYEFVFELNELSPGNYTVAINLTFGNITKSSELNFTIELPQNQDIYPTIRINQTTHNYSVELWPQDACILSEIWISPADLPDAYVIGGPFAFDASLGWNPWNVFEMIDDSVDFGSYSLCANISEIRNYNDTNVGNNFICENFTIAPPSTQTRARIKTFVASEIYSLNETLYWLAQLFPSQTGTVGNLTIALQKINSRAPAQIILQELGLNLTENSVFSGNLTIPDNAIEGIYKIRAKFVYSGGYLDSRDSGQFWLAGLKDLGPANISVLSVPSLVTFGGFGAILINFFSGNTAGVLRFLAYGYPKQVLMDTSGKGLTASSPDAELAIELMSIKRGQNYFIALPMFTKQNCGNDYADDVYRTRIRAYENSSGSWKELTTTDINLQISGINSQFCPSGSSTSTTKGVAGAAVATVKKPKAQDVSLEILSKPENVSQGENFKIKVVLVNNANITKAVGLYSYVYSGQSLMTEGGWTGNKQNLSLAPGEKIQAELENAVKQDAEPNLYDLRVRVKSGDKNIDADDALRIITGGAAAKAETKKSAAKASPAAGLSDKLTGAAIYTSRASKNTSTAIFLFLVTLVVLVLALLKTKQ